MLKYTVLLLLIAQTSIYAAEQNSRPLQRWVNVAVWKEDTAILISPPSAHLSVPVTKPEEATFKNIEYSLERCFPNKKVAIAFIKDEHTVHDTSIAGHQVRSEEKLSSYTGCIVDKPESEARVYAFVYEPKQIPADLLKRFNAQISEHNTQQ